MLLDLVLDSILSD